MDVLYCVFALTWMHCNQSHLKINSIETVKVTKLTKLLDYRVSWQ